MTGIKSGTIDAHICEQAANRTGLHATSYGREFLQLVWRNFAGPRPRLIDEHEALGIEIELAVEPALPLPQDVGSVLLDRVPGLFYS